MIAPIAKQITMASQVLFWRTIAPPMPWPKGVMEISAPSWKKPMPTMRSTAPVKNKASVPTSIGTSVTLSTSTMIVMGSTLVRASRVFSLSFSFIRPPFCR